MSWERPGAAATELHQRMLRSDPELLAVDHVRHPVLAPLATPAQLPTDLPVFVGREPALATAGAALPAHGAAPDRTTVIVIGDLALSHRVAADDVLRQVASIRQNLGHPSIGLP